MNGETGLQRARATQASVGWTGRTPEVEVKFRPLEAEVEPLWHAQLRASHLPGLLISVHGYFEPGTLLLVYLPSDTGALEERRVRVVRARRHSNEPAWVLNCEFVDDHTPGWDSQGGRVPASEGREPPVV